MHDRATSNDNTRDFKIPEHNVVTDALGKVVHDMCDAVAKKYNLPAPDKYHPAPVVLNDAADDKNRQAQRFLPEVTIHH
jgi:hypothetical protein